MIDNYFDIVNGIEKGLWKMKMNELSAEDFQMNLNKFKRFNDKDNYSNFDDDKFFWILTSIMFFNSGLNASSIEKKLPMMRKSLYGYEKMANISDSEITEIISVIGYKKSVMRVRENALKYKKIINEFGSFQYYLKNIGIKDTKCSTDKVDSLYWDLYKRLKGTGIAETAIWHFITELGFFSIKPDSVIRRIFYRLGLIEKYTDFYQTVQKGREISLKTGIPIRYIDIIFVKYGQKGSSNVLGTLDGICTYKNPSCSLCELKSKCKYFSCNDTTGLESNIVSIKREVKLKKSMYIINKNQEKFYCIQDYLNVDIIKNYSQIKFLLYQLKDKINCKVKERGSNDFVIVPSMLIGKSANKNVMTVWYQAKRAKILIDPSEPKKYYFVYTVDDITPALVEKIEERYQKLTSMKKLGKD